MSDRPDTIVAVSAPPGRSWRGMVRLSGDRTAPIVQGLLATTQPPWADQPRWAGACRLSLDGSASRMLPAMLSWSAGPRSYTGEDTAEVQCPGHPSLIERLMQRVMGLGARHAEAGEFTFRAFTAGKLDLTQAEGIHATIAATSDAELHAAAMLRHGRLGEAATSLVDALAQQLALTEAGIDFVDQDDVVPIPPAALHANVAALAARLEDMLRRSRSWGELQGLPRVVLAGAPSAGKSTLFNALLGRQRAVVSGTPGTTRDILAEPLHIALSDGRRVEVMLTDLAGLDEATSLLDSDAQRAAAEAIGSADLVLHVDDGRADGAAFAIPTTRGAVLHVRTKADLVTRDDGEASDLTVSATTGEGLDRLRRTIGEHCGRLARSTASDLLALQPRHEAALRAAARSLADTRAMLEPQRRGHAIEHIELVAGHMRLALDALAGLGGAMTPDDIIGKVFATFCIGK